jgi:thioredoxin-related protein
MKTMILGIVTGCLALGAIAAEPQWLTDLPAAKAKAKAEKKLVLLDFTGSDWCPPCKALHKNVLTSKEFQDFAKDKLVLVELDFPRQKTQTPELKKANRDLQARFTVEGYPSIIVIDPEGKELSREVGYSGAPAAEYVAQLKKKLESASK